MCFQFLIFLIQPIIKTIFRWCHLGQIVREGQWNNWTITAAPVTLTSSHCSCAAAITSSYDVHLIRLSCILKPIAIINEHLHSIIILISRHCEVFYLLLVKTTRIWSLLAPLQVTLCTLLTMHLLRTNVNSASYPQRQTTVVLLSLTVYRKTTKQVRAWIKTYSDT